MASFQNQKDGHGETMGVCAGYSFLPDERFRKDRFRAFLMRWLGRNEIKGADWDPDLSSGRSGQGGSHHSVPARMGKSIGIGWHRLRRLLGKPK